MSDSENKPIQDVLRNVAPHMRGCTGWACWWKLARALGLKDDDPGTCLEAIADRVDAQGVVTVTVPTPAPTQGPTPQPTPDSTRDVVRLVVEAYELGRAAR